MGSTVPHDCPGCYLSPCTIGLPCIFVRSLKAGFASSSFSVFPGLTYGRYFIKVWWNDWINQPTFQLGVATCYWSLGACHSEFLTRLEVFKLGNSTLPSFLFYFFICVITGFFLHDNMTLTRRSSRAGVRAHGSQAATELPPRARLRRGMGTEAHAGKHLHGAKIRMDPNSASDFQSPARSQCVIALGSEKYLFFGWLILSHLYEPCGFTRGTPNTQRLWGRRGVSIKIGVQLKSHRYQNVNSKEVPITYRKRGFYHTSLSLNSEGGCGIILFVKWGLGANIWSVLTICQTWWT